MAQDGHANTGSEAGVVMGEVMGSRLGSGASSGASSGGFTNPSAERPSASVSCAQTISIMPLRYSAIGSADAAALKKITPDFPADLTLGQGLQAVAALGEESQSRYGIRPLRAGHLYVFTRRIYVVDAEGNAIERKEGTWRLDYHLRVEDDKDMRIVSQAYDTTENLSGRTFHVNQAPDVLELRLFFSPEPLTDHYVGLIVEDPKVTHGNDESIAKGRRLREAMQLVDIKAILERQLEDSRGFKGQAPADVIPAMRIGEVLADALAMPAKGENRHLLRDEKAIAADAGVRILYDQLFPVNSGMVSEGADNNPWRNWYEGMAANTHAGCKVGGVAVAIYDPIAITQELNNWRNDALETYYYTSFLNRQTEIDFGPSGREKIPNKRLVHALSSYENISNNYGLLRACGELSQAWDRYMNKLEFLLGWINKFAINRQSNIEGLNSPNVNPENRESWIEFKKRNIAEAEEGKTRAFREIHEELKTLYAEVTKVTNNKLADYQKEFPEKLLPLVDQGRAANIREQYTRNWDEAVDESKKRIPGHLAWLQSEALKTAFDYFDNRTEKAGDPENAGEQIDAPVKEAQGAAFAQHVGLAIVGMEGLTEAYDDVYSKWWNPLQENQFATEHNLVMRAACFNNPGAFEAMKQLNEAIKEVEAKLTLNQISADELTDAQKQSVGFAGVIKWTKKVAGYFKKILSMEAPKNERLAGLVTIAQQFQNRLLAYGGSTRLDYGVFVFFRNFSIAQVGDAIVANEVASHYSGLNGKGRPRRIISRQMVHNWDKNYTRSNGYVQTRMASIMLVVDVINLAAVIFKGEAKPEDLLKIYSAALGTLGTAVSLYTTVLQNAMGSYELPEVPPNHKKGMPATGAGYEKFGTRSLYFNLKMVGACLSAAGATPALLIEAYKTIGNFQNARYNDNWLLATGYGVQFVFNAASLVKVGADFSLALSKTLTVASEYRTYNAAMAVRMGTVRSAVARAQSVALARAVAGRFAVGSALGVGVGRIASLLTGFNPIGITIFIITLVLPWLLEKFDNTDMETWLKRFTLRNNATCEGKPIYKNLQEETKYVQKALNNLTKGVSIDLLHQDFVLQEQKFLSELERKFDNGMLAAELLSGNVSPT